MRCKRTDGEPDMVRLNLGTEEASKMIEIGIFLFS